MPGPRRLGVLGGTFDPPHHGHLLAAAEARHRLSLDAVLLVVAGDPWQKRPLRQVSPAAARLAMVEALVDGFDGLEASDVEVRRAGPSYTADTLAELARRHPDTSIDVVLGHDAAVGLPTWERVDEVRTGCRIVVVDRPGRRAPLPEGFDLVRLEIPLLDISSTDLRDRVRDGRPLAGLTSPGVISVIGEHGLYRG